MNKTLLFQLRNCENIAFAHVSFAFSQTICPRVINVALILSVAKSVPRFACAKKLEKLVNRK